MTKEFRLAAAIPLPDDEFEQAAHITRCGQFRIDVIKLLETHKLSGSVGHETVTPRGRNATKSQAPAGLPPSDPSTEPHDKSHAPKPLRPAA